MGVPEKSTVDEARDQECDAFLRIRELLTNPIDASRVTLNIVTEATANLP